MMTTRLTTTWLLAAWSVLQGQSRAEDAQQPLGRRASLNDSLLWGPYRPNLYFGTRPQIPDSLLTGIIWNNVNEYTSAQKGFRHTCEQGEDMAGYGWEEYDVHQGGREVIHDAGNNIDITIDFVKIPGGNNGGSWGARISGNPRKGAPTNLVTTLVFYAGLEGPGSLSLTNDIQDTRYEGPIELHGQTKELGSFDIEIVDGPGNVLPHKTHQTWDFKPLDGSLVSSFNVPKMSIWQADKLMLQEMKGTIDKFVAEFGENAMPPPWQTFTIEHNPKKDAELHMVQKVFIGKFQIDILFKSGSAKESITSETLNERIPAVSKNFKRKFQDIFKAQSPFTKSQHTACAEAMFSNLLGGIGYFYGPSLADRSYATEYDEEDEGFWIQAAEARARNQITKEPDRELFTSVPSRPFFPRGFLWDEGFHLIPVVEWDADVTMQIVESWFRLIDDDGWIAREQILGAEAHSKVPQEFTVQYPHYANPPTLFMVIDTLIEKAKSQKLSKEEGASVKARLTKLYPLFKRQYQWFRRTQAGDIKSYEREAFSTREAYRWRGRTPQHILPSGLDDYPRAQPPHPGEIHLDLMSWMGLLSRSLKNLAEFVGESSDVKNFAKQHEAIVRNIDDLHWSSSQKTYCDATIDDYDEHSLVCHKGYISLFPFMTGLMPSTHPNLPHILNLISDPAHLWSDYGIRSLSKSSEFYGTEENYWRSPIWLNMNYLIVKSLLAIATDSNAPKAVKSQATKIYTDLRENLVENVVKQWQETGFAWEQYNPETGKGQRTQHFTGWTTLVVPIMGMPDLKSGVKAAVDSAVDSATDAIKSASVDATNVEKEEIKHEEL